MKWVGVVLPPRGGAAAEKRKKVRVPRAPAHPFFFLGRANARLTLFFLDMNMRALATCALLLSVSLFAGGVRAADEQAAAVDVPGAFVIEGVRR